jgi:hypothetical protein
LTTWSRTEGPVLYSQPQLPTRGQSPAGWMFFSSSTPRPCQCRGNVADQVDELTLRKSPKLYGQNPQVYCASFMYLPVFYQPHFRIHLLVITMPCIIAWSLQ